MARSTSSGVNPNSAKRRACSRVARRSRRSSASAARYSSSLRITPAIPDGKRLPLLREGGLRLPGDDLVGLASGLAEGLLDCDLAEEGLADPAAEDVEALGAFVVEKAARHFPL